MADEEAETAPRQGAPPRVRIRLRRRRRPRGRGRRAESRSARTARRRLRKLSRPIAAAPCDPPSWRRTLRRAAIFSPVMLVILYLLRPSGAAPASVLFSVALLMVFFIPFSYFMDTLMFRLAQKESREGPRRLVQVVALAVDRYELGPIGTNCYVVRAERTAPEAVVVDPGGDAAELRLELAQMGATCAAILVTHTHWDHLGGVADLAEGPERPCTPPRKSAMSSSGRTTTTRSSESPFAAWTPEHTLAGGETLEVAGISFEVVHVPGHSPGIWPSTPTVRSSPATCSSPARSAGPISRAPTGTRCSSRSACSSSAIRQRPSSTRATALRRRWGTSWPATRSSRSCGTVFEAPRGTHDILPSEQPAWRRVIGAAEDVCARSTATGGSTRRHSRTPSSSHARQARLGRRAEGDVHVRGSRRPLADATARRPRRRSPAPTSSTACTASRSR